MGPPLSAEDRVQAAVAERLCVDLVLGECGTCLSGGACAVHLHQGGHLARLVAALGDKLAVLAGATLGHLWAERKRS